MHKPADVKEGSGVRRRGRPRKQQNLQGKRLFDEQSSSEEEEEDSISGSDQEAKHEEEDDEPLIHTLRASSSKLRSLKLSKEKRKGPTKTIEELATPKTSGTHNITSFSLCSALWTYLGHAFNTTFSRCRGFELAKIETKVAQCLDLM